MEQKNKKVVYIIVVIVFLLIGLGAGYMLGKAGNRGPGMGYPPNGFQNEAAPTGGQPDQLPSDTNQGQGQ